MKYIKNISFKHVALGALMGVMSLSFSASSYATGLKENSLITGANITLGDVFYDLPSNSDKVLGTAPRPGKEITLNARTLLRVAIAMDLDWRPSSNSDRITLRRSATIVSEDIIIDTLKEEMTNKGVSGLYELHIPAEKAEMILPPSEAPQIEVRDLDVNREKNHFSATIVSPSIENPKYTSYITGSIERMALVPVLRSPMRAGGVIGVRDIEMISIPQRTLKHNTIVSADSVIGTTPRRLVGAGQPILDSQVEAPQIIERGEFITMTFIQGPLQLTARGKALEHGAKGDIIRIVNTSTNKTLEGTVTADKEVTVRTF